LVAGSNKIVIDLSGRYLPNNEIGLPSSLQPNPTINESNWLVKVDGRKLHTHKHGTLAFFRFES
jgi:hypothetical protein